MHVMLRPYAYHFVIYLVYSTRSKKKKQAGSSLKAAAAAETTADPVTMTSRG